MWVEIDRRTIDHVQYFVAQKEQKIEDKRDKIDYKQNVKVGEKQAAVDWDKRVPTGTLRIGSGVGEGRV